MFTPRFNAFRGPGGRFTRQGRPTAPIPANQVIDPKANVGPRQVDDTDMLSDNSPIRQHMQREKANRLLDSEYRNQGEDFGD